MSMYMEFEDEVVMGGKWKQLEDGYLDIRFVICLVLTRALLAYLAD